MQKPAETKKLYFIAAILYAAQIGLDSLLFPVAALLSGTRSGVQITSGVIVSYFLPYLLELAYPLLAVWLSKQKEITPQSTKLTAILLPSCWGVLRLLNLGIRVMSNTLMDAERIGSLSLLRNTVQIPLYLTGFASSAGFILLCCACAEEYVRMHPASDKTKRLSLYAVICAGAGLLLETLGILFSRQFGVLFGSSYYCMLPMKWKLVMLGLLLLRVVPFTAAAVWFWLKPDGTRPVTRLILAPILVYIPALLCNCITLFLIRLVAQDGTETFAAYSIAGAVSSMLGILHFAALILTCCAGTIAYFDAKRTPSDGALSNN